MASAHLAAATSPAARPEPCARAPVLPPQWSLNRWARGVLGSRPPQQAMKNLSAYIRGKGMKFGIYGAAGQTTCAGKAGGLYHE